ncbi:hypothetical protein AGABI2DRAFT_118683 [Agaricus bisporus var. bisporus H97]|uniref:hypothetical protein n=1 Tax=Agaricus bisporus var. bisporus (strain H97 / ATCC MYA-4626 / FGSC 10389) TaxID=936046 RepID=UPI00029F5711|nr:hypothetical protein AGABI2DRAFT_118683 [Agaricus bisporus var. bisporus H97]EKV46506.1 hypothetical protein AGABI2DRAFT_118683 [Agaricus bisporus var. bisporus H97]
MPPKNTQPSTKDPHVANTVKVTYLQRSRKTSKEPSADDLATPSSSTSVSRKPTNNIKSKTDALFKTPENPPIRIVDFRTETSPKRLQHEASALVRSGSVVLLEQVSKDTKSISSGASPDNKSLSSISRISQPSTKKHTYKDLGLIATIPFIVPRTEKIRKVLLALDDSAETVEPDQVKCKTCQEWVPLEKKYSIRSWSRHKGACRSNQKPSDIEQTLERKLFFMCDAQFKNFRDKHTVECRACNEAVALKADPDYDLDLWLEHTKTCHLPPEAQLRPLSASGSTKAGQEMQPQSNVDSTIDSAQPDQHTVESTSTITNPDTRVTSTARPVVPPESATLSTTDSERTLVPSSSSISIPSFSPQVDTEPTASTSRKRPRDSNEDGDIDEGKESDVDMDGERPARRSRLAGYIPEEKEAPTGLGWFTLPFQAFVKGFKESLTTWDS